jgi:hypothetical protein
MAQTYDLISSEYGWTDEVIGDLAVCRFQQIGAAIQLRRYEDERAENLRASWMTRTLAGFIAAGYMVEGENPAMESASKLTLDPVEAVLLGQQPVKPKENAAGSYERFMSVLGARGGQRPV